MVFYYLSSYTLYSEHWFNDMAFVGLVGILLFFSTFA